MKVRDLLTCNARWTKGTYAKDKDGEHVSYKGDRATCWCLTGAIYKCYDWVEASEIIDKLSSEPAIKELRGKANYLGNATVFFNDHPDTTFEDIKELVERFDL